MIAKDIALERLAQVRVQAKQDFIPILSEDCERVLTDMLGTLRPQSVLEIGTAIGYSSAWMCVHSDARIVTLDKDPERLAKARTLWQELDIADRIECFEGDAAELLPTLVQGRSYDLVFLDGPKSKYNSELDTVLPSLHKGSVVLCDDVDYFGYVPSGEYPPHKHRTIVMQMRAFLDRIGSDPRMSVQHYPQGNGIAVITIR